MRVSASGRRPRRRGGPRPLAIALAVVAAAVALAAIVSLALPPAGEALRRATGARSTPAALGAVALAPWRLVQARLDDDAVPRLAIDVKFKYLNRIYEQRERALRRGVLVGADDDGVPAELRVDGASQRGFLRLDASRPEELQGDQWPLRVRMRGDDQVLGFGRFALRSPAPRDRLAEGLFLDEMRRQDVPAPRIGEVDVSLNGKRLGVMTLVELPGVEMLERQQRRDGPMLRLLPAPPAVTAVPERAATAPLRPRHVEDSRKLRRHHKTAARLMRAYLDGSLAAGDVFDAEITGRYLALAELWGAAAMLERPRLRFYYNPLTAHFEPVASAAALAPPSRGPDGAVARSAFATGLLADPRLRRSFESAAGRLAGEMAAEGFAEALAARGRARLRALHRDRPFRAPFDPAPWLARAARVAAQLPPPPPPAPRRGSAPATAVALPLPSPSRAEVLARHPFLRWDAAAGVFRGAPGRWDVAGSIILPDGAGLALPAGSVLRFERRQGIIARGPLDFAGSPEAPVVLEGPPSAKRSGRWAGVYVIGSERPSRWSHVTVRNTGGWKRHGWFLAGGVVFRKAPVELADCHFEGNLSDDALNVVRSTFTLTNADIGDALSDGFDGDYVDGTIEGGSIARTGGDGIDVGGSRLVVRGVRIEDVRDKALVVGEGSEASAESLDIRRVGIAVASKNGSRTRLAGSRIDDVTDVALVAYTNRSIYGPGELVADGNEITRATLAALAQTGSRVVVDGAAVPEVDAAIDRLYKDGETDR